MQSDEMRYDWYERCCGGVDGRHLSSSGADLGVLLSVAGRRTSRFIADHWESVDQRLLHRAGAAIYTRGEEGV